MRFRDGPRTAASELCGCTPRNRHPRRSTRARLLEQRDRSPHRAGPLDTGVSACLQSGVRPTQLRARRSGRGDRSEGRGRNENCDRLHGLHGYDGNLVETISATTRRPRSGRFIFHHTDRLPDCDLVHVGPIPITTPTRTLVELGAALPPNLVEVALDSALRQGKTSLPGLHRKLAERCGSGHSGAGVLRRLLDEDPTVAFLRALWRQGSDGY